MCAGCVQTAMDDLQSLTLAEISRHSHPILPEHEHHHHDYHTSHMVSEDKNIVDAKAPEMLQRFLKFKKDVDVESKQVYDEFLQRADHITSIIKESPIHISSSFKYKLYDQLPSRPDYNSSINDIFMFYSRLDQVYSSTFSAADVQNETMNMRELLLFCQDFRIIPKLLNVREIQYLFKIKQLQMARDFFVTWNKMICEEFKDFLVRMAIFSYNKAGFKRLILNTVGTMPTPQQIVSYFAKYLHLDDIQWVRNHINTVGRQTQRDVNFRSADEKKLGGSGGKSLKMNLDLAAIGDNDDSDSGSDDGEVKNSKPGTAADAVKKLGRLKDRSRNAGLMKLLKATKVKEDTSNYLPEFLRNKLYQEDKNSDEKGEPEVHTSDDYVEREISEFESNLKQVHYDDDSDDDSNSVGEYVYKSGDGLNTNFVSAKTKNQDEAEENALLGYSVDLVRELTKYAYTPPLVQSSEIFCSEGPFIDMGCLPIGAQCVVKLHITNKTNDDLRVDVTCKHLDSDNSRVSTFPSRLIAGFTRPVSVKFKVQVPDKNILGLIDITCINQRHEKVSYITCPIFYRVGTDSLVIKNSTLCTIRTLPILLKERLRLDRSLNMKFERTNQNNSTAIQLEKMRTKL